ncbi:MAG: hypothetical protein QM817_39625 [Archangium sp.]
MKHLVLISCVALVGACRPPPAPEPEPEDAGIPDAGPITTVESCPAVPVKAQCESSTGCWKNPLPMATQPLTDVWSHGCTAWAVGPGGMLLERKSTGWAVHGEYSGARTDLYALAGTDTDDVWAVGAKATVLHFNGTSWTQLQTAWDGENYRGAWTNERNVVFIAGDNGVYRFEVRDWRTTITTLLAPPNTQFLSVSGSTDSAGHTTIHALGYELSRVSQQVAWTWDGRNAIREPMPSDGSFVRLLEFDDGRVYGVGSREVNSRYRATFSQLFPMQAPSSSTEWLSSFTGLAASAADDFIVVGNGSDSVRRFNGFSLEPVERSPSGDQRAVSFNGQKDFFVVGEKLGRVTDAHWYAESSGPTQTFTNVLALDSDDVWLSGGFRSRFGGEFTATFSEPNRFLGDIAGNDARDLLANEYYRPGLMHFDGTQWSQLANGPTDNLSHVVTAGTGESWAWSTTALWTNSDGSWVKIVPETSVTILDVLVLESGISLVSAIDATQTPRLWACTTSRCSERPTPARFRHLAGRGLFDCYGITDAGEIWQLGETNVWTHVATTFELNVLDAAVRPADNLLVMAGPNGTVGFWQGSRVFQRNVGAAVTFFGVGFSRTDGEVLAVGTGGTVVSVF